MSDEFGLHLLGSQTESELSQKSVLRQLLDEVLYTQKSPVDDPDVALKLLSVIVRGALTPVLENNEDPDIPLLISSFRAIQRTIHNCPGVITMNVPQTSSPIYKYISSRCIPFFVSEDPDVSSLSKTAVSSFWPILVKEPKYWSQLTNFNEILNIYLDNIMRLLEEKENLDHTMVLPSNTREDIYAHSYEPIKIIQLALNFLLLFDEMTNMPGLSVLLTFTDTERCLTVMRLVQEYLSFKQEDLVQNTPMLTSFIQICTKNGALTESIWYCLGLDWLECLVTSDIVPTRSSSLDIACAKFILQLSIHILSTNKVGNSFISQEFQKKLKTRFFNKDTNTGLSTIYLLKALNPGETFDSQDAFQNNELEKSRKEIQNTWNLETGDIFENIKDISQLQEYLTGNFDRLNEQRKISFIRKIADFGLFEAGKSTADDLTDLDDRPVKRGYEQLFCTIIRSDRFHQQLNIRLETISALTTVFSVFRPETPFNLDSPSDIVAWIIACLKSTSRELRTAAGRLLPYYRDKGSRNISQIFRLLSSFNFDVDTYLIETTIMAWAQMGKVCNGEQLNFILVYLTRLLGSDSSFKASVAFCEIRLLANFKKKTCWQLCSAFWSTISVMITKEMREKKVILKRFSELLGISEQEFLSRTASFTAPYLVLGELSDSLQAVADASDSSTKKLCLDLTAPIMAVLLIQDVEDPINFAKKKWYNIDPVFREVGFSEVLSANILGLSFELLKLVQVINPESNRKSRILTALAYTSQVKYGEKSDDIMTTASNLFNESFVLQLVTLFSETIRNLRGRSSDATKLHALAGIALMTGIAKQNLTNAVPQICTILQSALENEELQEYSMSSWKTMIENLSTEKWINIASLTFSVVIQKWNDLVPEAKDVAREMINHMIIMNTDVIRSRMMSHGLPSFQSLPEFSYAQSVLDHCAPDRTVSEELSNLLNRSDDENVYVVRQTLEELRQFLLVHQKTIEEAVIGGKPDLIKDLMRTLIFRSQKFRTTDPEVSLFCAQCIGLVGALDHHIIDINQKHEPLVVINNFNGKTESLDFVTYLLRKFLAKTYRASIDPSLQMFLAFGIQELLKFCGFTTENIKKDNAGVYWNKFSYDDQSTLYPLLSTKYTAPTALVSTANYPIFKKKLSYSQWLQTFTYDLMSRVTGSNAVKLFGLCRRMVRDRKRYQDMFHFILPYVALNVVIGGKSEERQNILNEMLLILQAESNESNDVSQFHNSVFSLVDYFTEWTRARKKHNLVVHQHQFKQKQASNIDDKEINIVEDLQDKISPGLLATRSFECKSYPRAIMYWERQAAQGERDNVLTKFENIYFALDDPDAHAGILALFSETSIDMQLRQFENTGKWGEALECYNAIMEKNKTWDLPTQSKALRCLKEDGRFSELLTRLDAYVEEQVKLPQEWVSMGIEVSWLTGKWPSLELWLSRASNTSYEINVGYALLALKEKNREELEHWITDARNHISKELSAMSAASLAPYSEILVHLHALADLESISHLVFTDQNSEHAEISSLLDRRMAVCGNNYATRRYLLALRRSAVSISSLPFKEQEVGLTWLFSARDARKQGRPTLAFQSCLQAMVMPNSIQDMSRYEYAKLIWEQGDQRMAIQTLGACIDPDFVQKGQFPLDAKMSRQEADMALKYTRWLDSSGQMDSDSIISRYKAICRVASEWENTYYYLAKYYNKLEDMQNALPYSMRNSECLDGTYVKLMVTNYARSLQLGSKFILESLPKLITTWLNFAQAWDRPPGAPSKLPAANASRRMEVIVHINNFLSKMVERIPAYVFYMALPQMLSRITVENSDIYRVLENIVVEVGAVYPRQALWPIMGVFYSKKKERKSRGEAILRKLEKKLAAKKLGGLLDSATKFAAEMILLCNFPPPERRLTVNLSDLEFDKRVFPCGLVLPIASQMLASLPVETSETDHLAFPADIATIQEIEEEVTIQPSLQKPKRITILASNGQKYKILCKPKDDVRKDARLMEFTNSVDKLLSRDADAHERHLTIKTYHVNPLNEDCGLIEWVDGAVPLRSIVQRIYSTKGIQINWMEIKGMLSTVSEAELLQNFHKLLRMYPPVLGEWFIDTFPEPANWLASRVRYARSCAVMSMVGYILGLGDRHGENVLFLSETGDVLHVDFDCLFDKGLSFEKPERVPFRLTHHMVDAMGITGWEGWFRKSSEVTLSVLRGNEDMLMNILEAFLHDPIVDWAKKRKQTNKKLINGLSAARSPEEALNSIKRKIEGHKGNDPAPLSVAGQVEYLIQQATSEVNLSQMYIGWAPFL